METMAAGRNGDELFIPRASMAGLFFAAAVRDTRGTALAPEKRYNHFPSSPLCSVTWVFDGEIFVTDETGERSAEPLPRLFVSGPYRKPMVSWSPEGLFAMTAGVYPEAWKALTGIEAGAIFDRIVPLDSCLAGDLFEHFQAVFEARSAKDGFETLQTALEEHWSEEHAETGSARFDNWVRTIALRAMQSGAGQSARQIQRRIKSWTGQTQRELLIHSRVETLFVRVRESSPGSPGRLAAIAAQAGYADQSHMGRDVRRVTGASPAQLERLIEADERYWCYRLLGGKR